MKTFILLFICFILFIQITVNDGKHVKGTIKSTKSDWVYITKFCFASNGGGNLTWFASSPNANDLALVFYDDATDSWPLVYDQRKKLSCAQKVEMSKGNRSIEPGIVRIQPFIDRARPHYWYFVVVNCNGGAIDFQYDFEFINNGGSWSRQFSFDEQGLAAMYLVYFLFYLIGIAVHIKVIFDYMKTGLYHPVIKIFSLVVGLQFFYIFFMFIHYMDYKNNGVGVPFLKGFGEVIDIAFQLVFMLLFILLAKGWAISKSFISEKLPLIILFGIFFLSYISMFIWSYAYHNYGALYIYESAPGIIILILRVFTLGWFLWCIRKSYLSESFPAKKSFYLKFAIFCSVWFLVLPLIVIIASLVSAWVRIKIVQTMYVTTNALALFVLGFLFWPSRVSEYFSMSRSDIVVDGGAPLLKGQQSQSPYETL